MWAVKGGSESLILCLDTSIRSWKKRLGGGACIGKSIGLSKFRGNAIASITIKSRFPLRSYCSVWCSFTCNHATSSDHSIVVVPDGDEDSHCAKTFVKGMTYNELEAWVQSLGHKAGQALMLWKCLYRNHIWAQHVDEMQGLSKHFRATLEKTAEFSVLSVKDVYLAADGTRKILFSLQDGLVIETVVIPFKRGRNTICVSSQVGCAMNCQFCYTGRMGFKKNLTTAEIVEQVVYARRLFTKEVGPLTNVVFMGMGEPLHNFENVIKAAKILVDCQGLYFSPRKVTVSTSGLVPEIRRFIHESPCELAVSLNATTDEVRNWIMPINQKYNLDMLLTTLREEVCQRQKYKVLIEYVMLAGINDSLDDARRLVNLVEGIPCKINLISFNPHDGSPFASSSLEQMLAFRNVIADAGYIVFIRHSRGDDQMAACGQLGQLGNSRSPRMQIPKRFQSAIAL